MSEVHTDLTGAHRLASEIKSHLSSVADTAPQDIARPDSAEIRVTVDGAAYTVTVQPSARKRRPRTWNGQIDSGAFFIMVGWILGVMTAGILSGL